MWKITVHNFWRNRFAAKEQKGRGRNQVEIIKWALLLIFVLPVPFFLGLIPVRYMGSLQRTPAMTYVCGWFVSFFVFELVAIPLILLEARFMLLVLLYTTIIIVLLLVSLWHGRVVWQDYANNIRGIKKLPIYTKIGWFFVFVLIALQMAYAVFFEYWDGDDAYYIATAVLTDRFDSMYVRDAYTGYIYPLDIRHAFSPTPIYQAWLSRISGIAPAVVAHTVLAPIWLLFMYCIYGQVGNRLLWNKKTYRPIFMLLIILWYAYGNISLYTAETFAMTRTWQGKGMMAGMVLPAMFMCLVYLAQERVSKGMWMLFGCVCLSAVFATSVSFMLVPTIVGIAALLIGLKKRSVDFVVKMIACCSPCFLLAICYLLVK